MEPVEGINSLTSEEKVNMSLDEIIRREGAKCGRSHTMQPKFQRQFKSQQWRLRGNGPGTPVPLWRWRPQPIQAFLQKRLRYAPYNSVFRRLGWHTLRGVAQKKLRQAKHHFLFKSRTFGGFPQGYRRPMMHPRFRRNVLPKRMFGNFKKLFMPNMGPSNEPKRLDQYNLAHLSRALGGEITSVREDVSPEGSVITTITRRSSHASSVPSLRGNSLQLKPLLDMQIQQHIAAIQHKTFEPSAYFPQALGILKASGIGVEDFHPTPNLTAMTTNERFSSAL